MRPFADKRMFTASCSCRSKEVEQAHMWSLDLCRDVGSTRGVKHSTMAQRSNVALPYNASRINPA